MFFVGYLSLFRLVYVSIVPIIFVYVIFVPLICVSVIAVHVIVVSVNIVPVVFVFEFQQLGTPFKRLSDIPKARTA